MTYESGSRLAEELTSSKNGSGENFMPLSSSICGTTGGSTGAGAQLLTPGSWYRGCDDFGLRMDEGVEKKLCRVGIDWYPAPGVSGRLPDVWADGRDTGAAAAAAA